MKRLPIAFACITVGLLFVSGCGDGSTSVYVGQWKAAAPQTYDRPVCSLSVLTDGTYVLRSEGGTGIFVTPKEETGRWKVDEDGLVLYAGESYIPRMICQRDGGKLVDRTPGGLVWERK